MTIDTYTLSLLISAFVAIGAICATCIMAYYYRKTKVSQEEGNKVSLNKKKEWHESNDIPCPGSLIVCEDDHHQLSFGYSVAYKGNPCLMFIPNYITDYRLKPIPQQICLEIHNPLPIAQYTRWAYVERRILPVQTLASYGQMYK